MTMNYERAFSAVIPARSGSSLADKNLRQLGGESLLARAVRICLESKIFEQVIVSSDSEGYLDHVDGKGITLHRRARDAASDSATAQDVVDDLAELVSGTHLFYLQPTSPHRRTSHIQTAAKMVESNPDAHIISVCRLNQHPSKVLLSENEWVKPVEPGSLHLNRLADSSFWYPNGAIYVLPRSNGKFSFSTDRYRPFIMNREDSLDIDTEEDFTLGEIIESAR